MNTKTLEKFAQAARWQLHEQVRARLEQVMGTDSPELRAKAKVVAELNKQIAHSSRQAVVEQVAYTWFNRFCALRFMDANRYTRLGVVSPALSPTGETFTQPEILQEAKAGHIDPDLAPFVDSQRIFDLLSGRSPSPNPQQEAYRLLLVGSCNQYHQPMPFLFEKIDHYSELLMPDDLLSASSILQQMREALTADACQDVEVIGWLYQFYISEKKDEVIGAKQAINPSDIPAATQLFTPHWIVRYLVENSLGRLWLLHRPSSPLAEQMEFYIREPYTEDRKPSAVNRNPNETDDDSRITDHGPRITDYLNVSSPEALTLCDPAVGSGHMLTYAFDLLYAIYEEEGYNPADIPRLILQRNLTGLEIDERAAALAAFALTMKARAKDRRFFRRGVAPNIVTLRPIAFTEAELDAEVDALLTNNQQPTTNNQQLTAEDLRHDLALFREADNVGSLLRPRLNAAQLTQLHDRLSAPADTGQLSLFNEERRKKARQAIAQAIPLAQLYDVVIANPPYLGNFNDSLKKYAKDTYPDSKSDLFAMFMERSLDLTRPNGLVAMINMQSWMFLSSYEKLREKLLNQYAIASMAHIGPRGFDSIGGEVVSTTAFVLENAARPERKGVYVRLVDGRSEAEKADALRAAIQNPDCGYFYRAAATDFKKIPGSPIAYWVSNRVRSTFLGESLESYIITEGQNKTANNDLYLRFFWEIQSYHIGEGKKWLPYAKGGPYRKWYGNIEYVIDWSENAREQYRKSPACRIIDKRFWNMEGITWTDISSSGTGFRYFPEEATFDMKGPTAFLRENDLINPILSLLNSKFVSHLLPILNPTMSTQLRDIRAIPLPQNHNWMEKAATTAIKCCTVSKEDWYSLEIALSFERNPLLRVANDTTTLAAIYAALRQHWQAATLEMQRLEEENNRLFIAAYGLQDELTPEVPLSEITLTCNPHYRYNANKSEAELETLLLADTLREFISYAIGCMFGRYSLDTPGLILANQGETVADYAHKLSFPRKRESIDAAGAEASSQNEEMDARLRGHDREQFLPDKDNAIPMLDGDWFSDDVTERFKKFLRGTFGETHYEENLAFIETALGRDIRGYFLREFYNDHVKMYKKRPIYWLFSSAKGSFNVLIYMHRYRPDTVSIVLNDYLREFRAKLTARKSHLEGVSVSASATPRDKTQALKEAAAIQKTLQELRDYEDDILYPLATQQVQIDLDDGVLVNYNKFGKALKKVVGLSE